VKVEKKVGISFNGFVREAIFRLDFTCENDFKKLSADDMQEFLAEVKQQVWVLFA
jgi:hypothetical protein